MRDTIGAEQRRHKRYEIKDRVFITFKPQFDRLGWITDISKGGVSLQYTSLDDYSELPEKALVDIFSAPQGFNLPNLHCKVVYDTLDDRTDGFIETRRCGLAFEEMSEYQVASLDAILNQCAHGTVS